MFDSYQTIVYFILFNDENELMQNCTANSNNNETNNKIKGCQHLTYPNKVFAGINSSKSTKAAKYLTMSYQVFLYRLEKFAIKNED